MNTYKKLFISTMIIILVTSLFSFNIYAEGWGATEDILEDKTAKLYAENDDPGDIDTLARFIKLNLNHEDFSEMTTWINKQNTDTKRLYSQWMPVRTVQFIESSEASEGTNGILNLSLFLWDGLLTKPSSNGDFIDSNYKYEVNHSFVDIDLSVLFKNNQMKLGSGGRNLIMGELNLKAPSKGNSGTSYISIVGTNRIKSYKNGYVPANARSHYTFNSTVYKKADWRYVGFSQNGENIPSPVLEIDYGAGKNLENRNYIEQPWTILASVIGDEPPSMQKRISGDEVSMSIFYDELFATYPKLKEVAIKSDPSKYNSDTAWQYWSNKLMWYTNPRVGAGIVEGWHQVWETDGWHYYYITFQTVPPAQDNVLLDDMYIYNNETDELVDIIRRDEFNESFSVNEENGIDVMLEKGIEYKVVANSHYKMGEYSKDTYTQHAPATLHFANDKDYEVIDTLDGIYVYKDVVTDKYGMFTNSAENRSVKLVNQMENDKNVQYEYLFTVPDDTQDLYSIMAKLDPGYYIKGDNSNIDDDFLSYSYSLAFNDMEAVGDVRLYQPDGTEVQSIITEASYYAEVTVKKPSGEKIIDKTMVDFFIDYGNGETKIISSTDIELKRNGTVTIKTGNIILPTTGRVTIHAIIDKIHALQNENEDNTNDNWEPKTFVALSNFTIKDFIINPQSLNYGQSQSFPVEETINLQALLLNENEMDEVRDVDVYIRQDGVLIQTERVTLVPDIEQNITWNVPVSIPNNGGNNFSLKYSIEINPLKSNKREYNEFVMKSNNPYLDNYKENGLTIFKTPDTTYECEVVDTYNTWEQEFTLNEWRGHKEYYDCSYNVIVGYEKHTFGPYEWFTPIFKEVEKECSRCETDSRWEDKVKENHYERFEITNIYFKSKVTTDNNGGWIDAMRQSAKIKAGYGFEMRVVTKYTTNVLTARPSAWRNSRSCDGMTYTPKGYDHVTPTRNVTVTMPYTDKFGDKMQFNLDRTSTSGSWTSYSQSFELPMRNSFGVKNERKIYVGEDVKVGSYRIEIDTDEFYGSSKKPYLAGYDGLCDAESFMLEIIGVMQGDTNTHVVE